MKKLLLSALVLCAAVVAHTQTQIQVAMPAQTSTNSPNVRGYYFTAPTCFTITGLEVPTDAGTGSQSIAVIRLTAAPPVFSATTNAFTTLFITQNNPAAGIIPCNIQVEQGDIIGIYGYRGTVNSYGPSTAGIVIEGIPTPIARTGMQFPLTTTTIQNVWSEPTSTNISRVWFYYDSLITYNMTATPLSTFQYQFSDGSDSSFTSVWDYGDGSPLDTAWDPTHTYATGGTFNVCSYITNSCGTDTVCTSITICNPSPAVAGFTNTTASGPITFTDASTNATAWLWDFGDATSSTQQNPVHAYAASGTYTVCLIAYNGSCDADTMCTAVTVCVPPTASYTSTGVGGGMYMFTDASTGGVTWAWDFGDGSPIDNLQNPSHTYALNGTYTVCVTVYGSCDSATFCDTLVVCEPTFAGFGSTQAAGTISFIDMSLYASSWSWDFGDGSPVDTTQNPVHTYTVNGTYTVCLIASGCSGPDTICNMVAACPQALSVGFTSTDTLMDATFTNGSMNASGYWWDFGDASTDTVANPTHTYANTGQYTVCLTAWNICGDTMMSCDTVLLIILDNKSLTEGSSIDLYPNPASESATINVSSVVYSGNYIFEMYDAAGKLVRTQNGMFGQNMTVDRSGLEGGIYIYKIRVDQNVVGNGRLIFTE